MCQSRIEPCRGLDLDRPNEVFQCFVDLAFVVEGFAEGAFHQAIGAGNRERALGNTHPVMPVIDVSGRCHRKKEHSGCGSGDQTVAKRWLAFADFCNPPNHCDQDADHWDIRVAVGMRDIADMDQSNRRNKRAQIPEPSHAR